MKIRHKLFFAFSLYIILTAFLGFFAYNGLQTIITKLALVETADDLTNTILEIRRHEKNYLLFNDKTSLLELKEYLGLFKRSIDNIKSEIIREIGNDNYSMMKGAIAEYEKQVNILVRGDGKDIVEKLRLTAREIQTLTEQLSKRERLNIGTALKMSMNLLVAALITMIVAGAVINAKLAASISAPIVNLEKVTKKVAAGDFSEVIEVKGNDEITSLEISFNQMEERLKDTMESLDATVKSLHEKQAKLVEAEKLASIGKFAAGIAHEINNPLTSVLTFSHLILEQCPKNDPRCKTLKMMVRETERARNIVRQLLSFSRQNMIKPERININQPVTEIIESLVAQEAFKDIELSMRLADDLPIIAADPAQIGQVVLNITLNAIHSIAPPGKIEIATRTTGRFVEIVFSDSGSGIPEEHLSKVFDPFFTTKEAGKGTGLGLAVSYGIIRKHGGDISVMSSEGHGTTFIVRLPVVGTTEDKKLRG